MGKEKNTPCPRDRPGLEGFGTNPFWDLHPQENQTEGVLRSEVIDAGGYSRKMQGKGLTQEPVTVGTPGDCPAGRAQPSPEALGSARNSVQEENQRFPLDRDGCWGFSLGAGARAHVLPSPGEAQ